MADYKARIVDALLERKLKGKGAVLVEGAKWCGKTTTAMRKANSVLKLGNTGVLRSSRQLAEMNPSLLLKGDTPRLIDEWQTIPTLWDCVRSEVDERSELGQFILTGSAVPVNDDEIVHSGTGRITRLLMRPMSLYESGESSGEISLGNLFDAPKEIFAENKIDIEQLAYLTCRGGWPQASLMEDNIALDQALDYFKRQKHPDYAEALRKQGKILMMQHDRLGLADFSLAKKAYQQYVKTQCADVARRLATMTAEQRAQYWLAIHQFLYDCYRLGNHAPDMLYDLALLGKGYLLAYEHNPKELQTTWKQVRAKLGRQDCAIEFVQYFARDDERRLGCLVLRHGSPKPVFVDLVAVDSLLETPVGYYDTLEDLLTSTSPFDKDILYTDSLAAHKVWSPQLMGLIAGARRVYFAPDGILHQWAIEYMIPDTAMVGYRLTSNALLCGGIDFNTPITPTATDNDVEAYRYLSLVGSEADSLPGSAEEVDSIYAFRNHPGDCVLKGAQATDEAFIARVKAGYDIIHLSTHGYYSSRLGLTNDIKPLLSDNSMSRSGVLFAGANVTLTDDEFDENLSDGVLSSTELARLDFGRTSLIVLSACQSGLGRITDDGIYGLERGLKQGGAGAMALTLWSVYDLPSSLLMRYFYRNLIEMPDHDIHAALLRARKQLSEYRHTGIYFDPETLDFRFVATDFDAPRYTHPFILIDAF